MNNCAGHPPAAGVWVIAEHADGRILPVSFELLTRGRYLADKRGTELSAVLLGPAFSDDDLRTLTACGAERVLAVADQRLAHASCATLAACLEMLLYAHRPEIVIAAATTTGRTLMPYVAVRVHAGLTADCTVLEIDAASGRLLQTRPAIGGNILATIETARHRPQMATVRPHSAAPATAQPGRGGEIVRLAAPRDLRPGRVRHLGFVAGAAEGGLSAAEVVVCVGRGIRKAAHIVLARQLAQALGGALAGTRDVVDRGWLSYPHQIGLSGKTVTPRLYIGLGVSGAIQHLAGMQTAQTIVAVNRDPDAPIFKVADFGIVGDLFDVVPSLIDRIRREGNPCDGAPANWRAPA